MKTGYHRQITHDALVNSVSHEALKVIIKSNCNQDRLGGQFGHPEFHFDDSAFIQGYKYIDEQRRIVLSSLANISNPITAWQAFGRLTHSAQDLYAHSNYVDLWLQKHDHLHWIDANAIDPIEQEILNNPHLRSGINYLPFDILTYFPGIGRYFRYFVPRNGHAWMNLDDPSRGERFKVAFIAAKKRTLIEFNHILKLFPENQKGALTNLFTGRRIT